MAEVRERSTPLSEPSLERSIRVSNDVGVTPTLCAKVQELRLREGEAAVSILESLATAIDKLKRYDWDGSIDLIDLDNGGGRRFALNFHPGSHYVLVLSRFTVRDSGKNPQRTVFKLLTIQSGKLSPKTW